MSESGFCVVFDSNDKKRIFEVKVEMIGSKQVNRRRAFRIDELVNLFYRKLDSEHIIEEPAEWGEMLLHTPESGTSRLVSSSLAAGDLEALAPISQTRENDTLNVNISASGIAFTCQESLQPGNYLMLRMLLLSTMTTIMACCRVVYCKPSNPYELDRYPYLIGGQFVNLASADRELLERYVDRRRKRQWITRSLLLLIGAAVLIAPGEVMGFCVDLGHHLLELTLHGLHLVFEYLELGLDHLVEHRFHTGAHETQIIVFYILVGLALLMAYGLFLILPAVFKRSYGRMRAYCSRKKSSLGFFWSQQTLAEKIRLVGFIVGALATYFYLGM